MREVRFDHEGGSVELLTQRSDAGWTIQLPGGGRYGVSAVERDGAWLRMSVATVGESGGMLERALALPCVQLGDETVISYGGQVYLFTNHTGLPGAQLPGVAGGSVTAPTGGVVADILAAEGDLVEAGQQIAVIEAMKVMTPVEAHRSGRLNALLVARGERVERDAEIARIGDEGAREGPVE